jgi:hypothetical protein
MARAECERIDNKVDVFSKTFLGLTVSCARCHDHKFDPIRAQDYYAMSGFFLGSSFRQVRFEAMENNRRMARELAALRERFAPQASEEARMRNMAVGNAEHKDVPSRLRQQCRTMLDGRIRCGVGVLHIKD